MLPTHKTPPKDKLSDLTALIYGPTKIGKSTWCSQAEGAIFLATEPGLNNLEVYQVPITNWEELLVACAEVATSKHSFRTVILDTADNAFKMCSEYVCQKNDVTHESELAYGKGYALVAGEFLRVLTKLAFLPTGLFLVSHAQEKEIETRTGRHIKTVPTLPERPRQLVLGMADLVLFCDLEVQRDAEGNPLYRRVMRTKPSIHYEAGDRTGRLPDTIPLDYGIFLTTFGEKKETAAAKAVS
ncbi:MAG: ATP-binding protein [Candidatus Eisenbacteria bacterium]